jgi:hypothetical protein
MPNKAKWMPAEPEPRPPNRCGSWPHCDQPPGEGRFCAEHQPIMDRVRAGMRKPARYDKPVAAPVAVSHVAPEAMPKQRKVSAEEFSKRILAALVASGTLGAAQLAARCLTTPSNRTFARARMGLVAEGKIVSHGPNHGATRSYSLPAAEQAA